MYLHILVLISKVMTMTSNLKQTKQTTISISDTFQTNMYLYVQRAMLMKIMKMIMILKMKQLFKYEQQKLLRFAKG